jgi:threonine/homoserine/homoserine lactone efflux protein
MPASLISLFLTGTILGFSIAAPVGPIGILCIRRTLAEGRRRFGLAAGIGAATADAVYGSIAAFGLTFISSFLIDQQDWLRVFGGIFLCFWACAHFQQRLSNLQRMVNRGNLWSAYGSTFFLTLTNPMTILSFAAIFAGFNLAGKNSGYAAAAVLVSGVFAGSSMWWLSLSTGVGLLRKSAFRFRFGMVKPYIGSVIFIFGLAALFSVL